MSGERLVRPPRATPTPRAGDHEPSGLSFSPESHLCELEMLIITHPRARQRGSLVSLGVQPRGCPRSAFCHPLIDRTPLPSPPWVLQNCHRPDEILLPGDCRRLGLNKLIKMLGRFGRFRLQRSPPGPLRTQTRCQGPAGPAEPHRLPALQPVNVGEFLLESQTPWLGQEALTYPSCPEKEFSGDAQG